MMKLAATYGHALADYLAGGGEAGLERAYELGRRALALEFGLLEALQLHHGVLATAFAGVAEPERLRRSQEFLAEFLSPFEMTQRAYGEANAALSRWNDALEAETRRIARALHDESGQLLAAVHLELRQLAPALGAEGAAALARIGGLLERIEAELRAFARELRPTVLDDYGLVPALRAFIQLFSQRTGLPVRLEGELTERLPPAMETALYRIGQEALNNAARHAHASQVGIRLWRAADALHCHIWDDGVGLRPEAAIHPGESRGLGLLGMRERLASLHGNLEIHTAPQQGTELRIRVPFEA